MADPTPAAQYIRMSTEHQRYSPLTQAAAIQAYAEKHGFQIVSTYKDHGKSGVTLKGRDGLKQLLTDVLGKSAEFKAILVLDVSRWGRFQDPDQAAHYEFLCREAGIAVRYCAEPFENDGSAVTSLVKQMKRVMAGEYSRELGIKTLAGAITGTRLGFKQGGTAPLGLRRMLLDAEGAPVMMMNPGQRRFRAGDKVVFVQGPAEELRLVRLIFKAYVREGKGIRAILRQLKAEGARDDAGRPFSRHRIFTILQQRLYTGVYTYNRSSQRLHTPVVANPVEDWVTCRMLEPIISARLFERARRLLQERASEFSYLHSGSKYRHDDLLDHLRSILEKNGRITHDLIEATAGPSARAIIGQFGSLQEAYLAVGYSNFDRKRFSVYKFTREQLLDGLRGLLNRTGYLTAELINDEPDVPSAQVYRDRFGSLIQAYHAVGWQVDMRRLNIMGNARRVKALSELWKAETA